MEYSNLKPIRLIIQCFNDILDIFFNLIFFSNLWVAPLSKLYKNVMLHVCDNSVKHL